MRDGGWGEGDVSGGFGAIWVLPWWWGVPKRFPGFPEGFPGGFRGFPGVSAMTWPTVFRRLKGVPPARLNFNKILNRGN